ncbi:MAG TPA: pyridoxal phosphate-dependent aminotransferase [Roseomonas sp.]|jgi:aspartate aminotransferase
MPALAQRLQEIALSGSTRMSIRARELREAGHKVISLTVGEPDFATPPHAIEAAHQAALAGRTKYPPNDGWPELKAAVQRKFRRENGLDYALDEIMIGNGGKQVILDAILATVDQGDEIVIPTPFWSAYADIGKLAGGVPVLVPCPQNNGFKLRPEDLEAAITPKTKWVVLNFPSNPSGAALTRGEVAALAEVLLRHPHVWVLSDDMYEHIIHDDIGFHTVAQVEPRLKDRVLTVSGASKTYAMTGWRVGFCGGPRALIKAMTNMQSQTTNGIATVAQAAAIAALDGPQDGVAERARIYRERRDLVVEMLNQAPGLQCHKPEGAFYVYPSVAGCLGKTTAGGRFLETDEDVAMALLEENHVATVSGTAYFMSPYIRLSYATDTETLREACTRIQDFCRGLK